MKKLILAIIFAITFVSSGFSQDSTKTNKANNINIWADLGAGFYSNTNFFRLGTAAWMNVSHNNTLFKFRYEFMDEAINWGAQPVEFSKNYALMVGRIKGNEFVQVSATAGLGLLTGVQRGNFLYTKPGVIFGTDYYEEKKINSICLPFEFDCAFKPLPVLAFGASITGDLSPKQNTFGMLVKVGVGLFPEN